MKVIPIREDIEEMRRRATSVAKQVSEALTKTQASPTDVFAIMIRRVRGQLGMDRLQFANYAKIGSGTVELIELRQLDPCEASDKLLGKLARGLGMTTTELLELCGVTTTD